MRSENEKEANSKSNGCCFSLRSSIFPHNPPFIYFPPPDVHPEQTLPLDLKWIAAPDVSDAVAGCVQHAGFLLCQDQHCDKEDPDTCAVWEFGANMEKETNEIDFTRLTDSVKINQFPGVYTIGRKDCLWKSYKKMVKQFGEKTFGFVPKTFIISEERDELVKYMEDTRKIMIVKPPNWFSGLGVKIINRLAQLPKQGSTSIVQEYIDKPFLINGQKFDIRLYVLMTSIDPIQLYIYEDGIVSFATAQYDTVKLNDNFIHLTNSSINKTSSDYIMSSGPGDYSGHKWNLDTLWRYLEQELGIDWRPMWEEMKDICIKTILCGHQHIKQEVSELIKSDYNCYKLFGIDFMLDENLKPWMLEVNNNPPLLENSIDSHVNGAMLSEMFNIVGFHIPPQVISGSEECSRNVDYDSRIYFKQKTNEEKNKIKLFTDNNLPNEDILENLTPSDVRLIMRSEEELSQTRSWNRIFPTSITYPYLKFLSSPSYSDSLLNAWVRKYNNMKNLGYAVINGFCEKEYHLKIPIENSDTSKLPLRSSLFPNVPPYIQFIPTDQQYDPPLPEEMGKLTWNAPEGVSSIVSNCVEHAGFKIVDVQVRKKENQCSGSIWDCLPVTEKEKDEINFSALGKEVKINQFPGLFVIGRKDHLSICYENMVREHGPIEFNFLPKTYILPDDRENLKEVMQKSIKPMIVKPPNWFCGIGIKVINKLEDIPSKEGRTIVQDYINNPFLIRGLKFDIRLYILLTSIDPIKLYIYEEGLVRFATVLYTNDPEEISNNFIHLTNFSVNKESEEFVYNESPGDYSGHKWNLATLWRYLEQELGIDWRPLWEQTKDICVKTLLCGHQHIKAEVAEHVKSDYNCYKLFGFDVMFDDNLKPWLLEVNNIPSLHKDIIDAFVNKPMLTEMLNIVGFHIPKHIAIKHHNLINKTLAGLMLEIGNTVYDERLYSKEKLEQDISKQKKCITHDMSRDEYVDFILDDLTPYDLRTIIRSEDEMSQTTSWTRIFPTPNSYPFLKFLSYPSYSDRLLDAWVHKCQQKSDKEKELNTLRKLCKEKYHLKVPESKKSTNGKKVLTEKFTADELKPKPKTGSNTAWIDLDMFSKFQ